MPRRPPVARLASVGAPLILGLWRRVRRTLGFWRPRFRRLRPEDGYRLWSSTYDAQSETPFFKLDQDVFAALLVGVPIADQIVLDVGCGTGRHWARLLSLRPRSLFGTDSSPEMLAHLQNRYREAVLHLRTRARLDPFADESIDVLVSNLMLGHVSDLEEELREWVRLLRPRGEIIVTDLHPEALQRGARTTFAHGRDTFEIDNHLRSVDHFYSLFRMLDLRVARLEERFVDGKPVLIGFRLHKGEGSHQPRATPQADGFLGRAEFGEPLPQKLPSSDR